MFICGAILILFQFPSSRCRPNGAIVCQSQWTKNIRKLSRLFDPLDYEMANSRKFPFIFSARLKTRIPFCFLLVIYKSCFGISAEIQFFTEGDLTFLTGKRIDTDPRPKQSDSPFLVRFPFSNSSSTF